MAVMAHPQSIFTDPAAYADVEGWHRRASELRRSSGLIRVEDAGHHPFLAAVRHADVSAVERNSKAFKNAPFPILTAGADRAGSAPPVKNLIGMDDADHQAHRAIIADWFNPRALRDREAEIRSTARMFIDRMADGGDRIDFASSMAIAIPLRFIASTLGVPEEDEDRIHEWTRAVFGANDPEIAVGSVEETIGRAVADLGDYFVGRSIGWRAKPDATLGSVIANARIDGRHLAPDILVAYFVLLSAAGHDTVATVLAGGLEALARHPEQYARLRDQPELVPNAVEEMLRWVTPTKHFMRTAVADCRVGDTAVSAGDWILLSYPSANRDEAAFAEPMKFDVGRKDAIKHLAFGIGPHFCVGHQLARMQIRIFFEELLPRLDRLELVGPVEYTATTFVSTFKRLPLRIQLRDRPA